MVTHNLLNELLDLGHEDFIIANLKAAQAETEALKKKA